jgi:outer membrane usher protein
MGWPPTRYRRPSLLALTLVCGTAGRSLAAPETGRDHPDGSAALDAELAGEVEAPGPMPAENPLEERPAFLHETVNQIDVEDVFVVLRGKDALLKVSDLQKAGLRVEGGTREKRGEDDMVWLQSLAPRVTFATDERNLTLTITADPKLFETTTLDLRTRRPEGILYGSSPSLFANYLVRESEAQSGNGARASGFAEAGLSLRGHLLYASGQRSSVDGTWQRLLTSATFDFRERLASVVVGDFTATGDVLGGGVNLGGLSIARNYSLDPYFVFLPTQRLSGTALTPSTVEVYVNGQLVRRESLAPGQFNMQNIPVTTGSGDTRVVVRDAFGATQTIANPYYMALGTLAKGLHDFSYNLGFQRQNFGFDSWNYGRATLLSRHRYGLTDWLTVGARLEGNRQLMSGGPSLTLRLPLGEVGVLAAASYQEETFETYTPCWSCTRPTSHRQGFVGGAGLISYSYIGRPLYLQAGIRYQSSDYASLALTPAGMPPMNPLPVGVPSAADRQSFDLTASIAKNIGRVASASLQYEATEWREQGWIHRFTLMFNRTVNKWMYAFATFGNVYSQAYPAEFDTFIGLSFAPADRLTAGVTRSDRFGGQSGYGGSTQAMVQQSLPVGPGLGYRVVATQGQNDVNQANAQYQGAYGRVEADYQHQGYDADNRGHLTLTATGGFVAIGGRGFFTRSNQDSFALIRVPGVPGVHGSVSNQVIGTTDPNGDLLVPNLLHYYGNRIGIEDKDIPLDHDIGAVERTIAPPFRGGMIVTFPVRRVQSVSGTVVVDEHGVAVVPTYGQIVVTVGDRHVVSPLDEAGNFYLEDLAPGHYLAEVQYATGACQFPLIVAEGSTALVNVGTVECRVQDKEQK